MFDRGELVAKYTAMIARGEPIIGGGAGTGLSAKGEEAGGVGRILGSHQIDAREHAANQCAEPPVSSKTSIAEPSINDRNLRALLAGGAN